MKIRWLGHSAFSISTPNTEILIDPFIRDNPACPVEIEDLKADIICVTHGHKDHFGDTVELAEVNDATVICNHEHSVYLAQQDLDTIGMNMGGTVTVEGITVSMVNAIHSSDMDFIEGIGPGGSSCGFILQLENGRRIYHAGDTSIFGDMEKVVKNIYRPQIALLPIGDRFTMGITEASIAASWIKPEIIIPMHYNTFPVIEQNPERFKELVELSTDTEVTILKPGETYQE
ncbi:metal-dependent hydrolase [Methanobacterium petrolearium]|uniref:metal-dependent hydrolase n=1 Tax=Methanobacterium petrolearium TaxID=710190 RepID=UPI001AE13BA3|nr:metal-dependent hydrolase [Methanobacterium petrolearium]MBP1945585.1 L-ascorbate metabolism protein UlaG (beta-lactamase superfamily) [Methanobacterium petrolearium]